MGSQNRECENENVENIKNREKWTKKEKKNEVLEYKE